MFQYSFTAEFGIMSTAVLTELLKTLVGKELLTPVDVRNVLQRAIHEISEAATEPTMRARSLIENELLPQFSERDQ
jgi:hypothetical protein